MLESATLPLRPETREKARLEQLQAQLDAEQMSKVDSAVKIAKMEQDVQRLTSERDEEERKRKAQARKKKRQTMHIEPAEATKKGSPADFEAMQRIARGGSISGGLSAPAAAPRPKSVGGRVASKSTMKTGWLSKRGQLVKSWKTRYFVLNGGWLRYFDSESATNQRGAISLKQVNIVDSVSGPWLKRSCCFQVVTFDRTYYISAPSLQVRDEWIDAVRGEIFHTKDF